MKLIFAILLGVCVVSAQTVYEAESSSNTFSGSAVVGYCSPCSGQKNVEYLGGPGNGTLQINGVKAAAQATYAVTFFYDNGASVNLPALVSANGGTAQTLTLASTGSWNTLAQVTVNLALNAGANSIKIKSVHGNYVAEIDKIAVAGSTPPIAPPPPPPPPPVLNTVKLSDFGTVGQGGDDTAVFKTAINTSAANKETLEVSPGLYNVQPLSIPSNTSILMDAGATVQATSGYAEGQRLLNIVNVSNVRIAGTPGKSIFKMRKAEYTSSEYRHCLDIEGANDVTVSGIACNDSGGDGLYIGGGSQGYSNGVSVTNSTFDNNRRQGFSLISGKNITINGCAFTNTIGTAPQDGIDIEPNNTTDHLENILIENSTATGNSGNGVSVSLWLAGPSSPTVSITISNVNTAYNAGSGFYNSDEHDDASGGPSGNVKILNSSSTMDGAYGLVASYWDTPGLLLDVQGLTVNNANQSGNTDDSSAVAVRRGGGDGSYMGNASIMGTSISDTTGKLGTYFSVEDYSNVGLKNIHINSFGTLNGVPSGASVAIVNGQPQSSVNIQ